MSNRFRGHRGAQGDHWNWEPPEHGAEEGRKRRRPVYLFTVVAAGSLAVLGGVAILVATNDDGVNGATPPPPSSTAAAVSASPEPEGMATFNLALWSRQENAWRFTDFPGELAYMEGDLLPIMVQIEHAVRGNVYRVELRYQCLSEGAAAFDYLGSTSAVDATAIFTDPGPGRRPDSTLPVPDDASIRFDDAPGRLLQLWGGTFDQPPALPVPASICHDQKSLSFTILAQKETLSLVVGAHLASARDWGEGKAASSTKQLSIKVSVDGLRDREVIVPPSAILH